jgi:quercetin dioxygenase-like cupin family protein
MQLLTRGPDEGRQIPLGTSLIVYLATTAETAGRFEAFEIRMPGGGTSPAVHRHQKMDETFYVLQGEVLFILGEGTYRGRVGSYVAIPRGTWHGFTSAGPEPATVLSVHTPAGAMDEYFEKLSRLLGRHDPETHRQIIEVTRQYDAERRDEETLFCNI